MLCGGCFFFNWGVVALPCWASFCCTATWISCNSPHPLLSWFSLPTPHTLFSIIASSSLSLRFCSLPQSSVRTPRAPGNVLCYRKWLEGEGLRTHPKSLQKAHHPSRSPFLTRNSVSALWLPHLPHEKVCVCVCVWERERGGTNTGQILKYSTHFTFCEENDHLWAQKTTVGLSSSGEKDPWCHLQLESCSHPGTTIQDHTAWPGVFSVSDPLWSFRSCLQVL